MCIHVFEFKSDTFFLFLCIDNGELCFESIETEDRNIQGSQITGSSGELKHLPRDSKELFTSWVHNFTDLTPWIMVGFFVTNIK